MVDTTAYGTTLYGGKGGAGTLFAVTSQGKVVPLHNFAAATDGSQPNDMLAVDPQGNVYGTTQSGGTYGGGTIYEFTATHTLKVLHAFDATIGDGAQPLQGLVRSGTGALFGAAAECGRDGSTNGSVFEINPTGGYITRYRFLSEGDGHCPFSGVAVDGADNVYGTVVGNGFGGDPNGAVWKLSMQGKLLTPLYLFKDWRRRRISRPVTQSRRPAAGNLYGTIITMNGSQYAGSDLEDRHQRRFLPAS